MLWHPVLALCRLPVLQAPFLSLDVLCLTKLLSLKLFLPSYKDTPFLDRYLTCMKIASWLHTARIAENCWAQNACYIAWQDLDWTPV